LPYALVRPVEGVMCMINYYKTVNGRIEKINAREDGCWVNVVEPNTDEINELIEQYKVEPEFIRSSMDEEETSHIEKEEGHTFIIVDVPYVGKAGENIIYSTMPVGIIITEKEIITISIKDNPVICEFSDGAVKNVHTSLHTHFVLHILLRMATRYLQYLKQIDKHSSFLESRLRRSMKNKELIQLLDIEKSLVYFQTSLKANQTTLQKILRGKYIKMYDEDQDLLEDVLIEVTQAIEMSNIHMSILSGTMDAFASLISNNLNIVMKVLTSITIMLSIPTMIFSFFGMNIGSGGTLPFSNNIIFPLILSFVTAGIAGLILYKKNMF